MKETPAEIKRQVAAMNARAAAIREKAAKDVAEAIRKGELPGKGGK